MEVNYRNVSHFIISPRLFIYKNYFSSGLRALTCVQFQLTATPVPVFSCASEMLRSFCGSQNVHPRKLTRSETFRSLDIPQKISRRNCGAVEERGNGIKRQLAPLKEQIDQQQNISV